MAKNWYIVQTQTGQEESAKEALEIKIAKQNLGHLFGEILVPIDLVKSPKTKRMIKRKVYPGYVILQMDPTSQALHLVKETPKVSGFIGGKFPAALSEKDLEKIIGGIKPAEPEPVKAAFKIGDLVQLTDGSYASMIGTVEEINTSRSKVKVSINMFGRPVSTELGFSQVVIQQSPQV
jgi:transcriptional antiterminator NusG